MGSHTELSQTLFNMKTLLVCSVLVAASSAQLYAGFGYPYALGAPLTYTPHVVKPVIKEGEGPGEHITYGIKETGCTNVFGFAVPCLAEGEARRKRSADEEAEVEATVAAPALTPPTRMPPCLWPPPRWPRWRCPRSCTNLSR